MIQKFKLILLVMSLFSLGQAQMIETPHIADALPYIDKDTWVLVDLDNTLYQAKDYLGHANWVYDQLDERLQKGMSKADALKEFHPIWVKRQETTEVIPLEEEFVTYLLEMQKQGIVIMGLTHRPPSVAHSTIKQVNSIGFNFLPTAPSPETLSIPATDPTLYLNGILFVSDMNKKEEVFLPFLNIIGRIPKKVVFIDDRKKNVVDLISALEKTKIECVGIYYTAIDQGSKPYLTAENESLEK